MVARVCLSSEVFRAIVEIRDRVWFWKALEEEREESGGDKVDFDRLALDRSLIMVYAERRTVITCTRGG